MPKDTNNTAGSDCSEAPCSALIDCMKHLEIQSKVRKRHSQETRAAIERMSIGDYPTEDEYENVKAFNIRQADFDAEWGDRYQKWADAIREILPPNA